MLPWMRDQIAEAWQNRKSSRASDRRSLTLSSTSTPNPESEDAMNIPVSSKPDGFVVNVISLQGNVLGVPVKPDFTIAKVKAIVMKHLYGQDNSKFSSQYRLIHSSKFKQLVDESSIKDEEINDCDELLLVETRTTMVKEDLIEEALRGPDDEAIAQATSGLVTRNLRQPVSNSDCPTDSQSEIRKILITLVQASARILMHSRDANEFYEIIREKLEARCRPVIDPKMVKTLVEMGYPEKIVLKALRLRKSNITEALEWLIDHRDDLEEEDEGEDEDLELIRNLSGASSDNTASSSTSNSRRASADVTNEPFNADGSKKTQRNLVQIVELLLNSFRKDRRLNFKPNAKALESLLELGFEEKSIIDALRATGNDQANAMEWLQGERRKNLQDLDEGLDSENPIYKAIMSNPHIQLSLTNPKLLLAYLSMLETPASTNVWVNDPEVSPVLGQIFKIYNAEKHALHMNRCTTAN